MNRCLVTTSDVRIWGDKNIISFLSEGCIPFALKDNILSLDSYLYPPYGINQETKDDDRVLSKTIEDSLYLNIIPILNESLNIDFNKRQWQIFLGKWLRRFVDLTINRTHTIHAAFENRNFDHSFYLDIENHLLNARDSLSFIWNCNDPEWNSIYYYRIIKLLYPNEIKLIPVRTLSNKIGINYYKNHFSLKRNFKKIILKIFRVLSTLSKTKVFILTSYLPLLEELILQIKLGQLPIINSPVLDYKFNSSDLNLRKELSQKLLSKLSVNNSTYKIAFSLFFEVLPNSFLEDFQNIKNRINNTNWPKNPNVIFTSNNFDVDEVFKLYTASRIKSGSKYVIGQHGNNYGTYRYMHHTNEEITSDAFLTWGWKKDLKTQIPAFIFKRFKNNKFKFKIDGFLLLIQYSLPSRFETWDLIAEQKIYFQNQINFVQSIYPRLKDKLLIRLHKDHTFHDWNEPKRWEELNPNLNIELGNLPITKLVKKAKLVVHSYDSTGLLETLSSNIPTMAFWINKYDHLLDHVIPDYELLEKVGIVHLSIDSLNMKISEVWDKLDDWWISNNVQNARVKFCEKYAVRVTNPTEYLKNIIDEIS